MMRTQLCPDSPCVDHIHPSMNFEERVCGTPPRLVVLHYTGMASCEKAIDWLSREESKVSCHYVIDEDGVVTQMVTEDKRAWHAGLSYWRGITDVNSASIGIEIHNPGHDDGYPDYPDAQMDAVRRLSVDICRRWGIRAEGVIAHSDIAPARKMDPGEKFDWRGLAEVGVGVWVPPEPACRVVGPHTGPPTGAQTAPDTGELSQSLGEAEIARAQRLLFDYGYGIAVTGRNDAASRTVVTAFQRHFRPERIDGLIDVSTLMTAERLVEAVSGVNGTHDRSGFVQRLAEQGELRRQ